MPIDRFATTFRVAAPPATVHAYLMDPHSYVGLAPLVVAVRDIRPHGDDIEYVAIERFRLGPFHHDNPIRVTLTSLEPDRSLKSAVASPGGVRLTSTVTLAPAEGGSAVTDEVVLESPWWVRWFAVRKAREAQQGRAAELTRRLAAPAP